MNNNEIRNEILDLSRQNSMGDLNDWFSRQLDLLIQRGYFPQPHDLKLVNARIIRDLSAYRRETNAQTVVIGMSGGVDSALTAALYKKAGYRVIGVTMPINQVQAETDRGMEACEALGIEHKHIDLSALYEATLEMESVLDDGLTDASASDISTSIRRGNIRARLRMITLYNLANLHKGFVASTDNLSELAAGFWTLHGDVGDLSPIQALSKSWEVPYLAQLNGVPESTVRAKPTDGLGVLDGGDEAQLGCSYLEWDIMFFSIYEVLSKQVAIKLPGGVSISTVRDNFGFSGGIGSQPRQGEVFDAVTRRMQSTWFKRKNPLNIEHALQKRYDMLDLIDDGLFVAPSFRRMDWGRAG